MPLLTPRRNGGLRPMVMSRDEIYKIVIECIGELFAKDLCLLQIDVSERAITHKLAEYLQQRIPYLNVDCEYNRNSAKGERARKTLYLREQATRQEMRELIDTGS